MTPHQVTPVCYLGAGHVGNNLSFDCTPFDGLRAGRTGFVRGKQGDKPERKIKRAAN